MRLELVKAGDVSEAAWEELAELLLLQSGVIARRQVIAAGLRDHDVRRMLRRREWAASGLGGVYVDHTGELTWLQRAWASVLVVWPAALHGVSAIRAADGPGRSSHDDTGPIHVAIDRDRVVAAPSGVRLHRIADFAGKVQSNASPPRERIEHAVVDAAAEAKNELDAVGVIADAVRSRCTTAARLAAALDSRSRIARRAFLSSVIADVGAGTCSTLEHGYLDRVERAHGLPTAGRQVRASSRGTIYRDVDYEEFDVSVEIDGTTHHTSVADRDRDLDRDLDAAVLDQRKTVRLGWGQVFDRPCRTASRVGALLQRGGWPGEPGPCSDCEQDSGGSLAADG